MKSKSVAVGVIALVLGAAVILAACFGLKAIGDNRTDDVSRAAAGADYSSDTTVKFTVQNSLPIEVLVDATVSDESGWNGTKPTDVAAFAGRKIAAAANHGVDLVFATARSKVPFSLTFKTAEGTSLGTVDIDRDYLRETCTQVKQGSYTVNDCSQVNVWWLAPASTFNDTRILGKSSSCPSSGNSVNLAEYTDTAGKKQQVKFALSCSSTTGATTGTLSQTAVATK